MGIHRGTAEPSIWLWSRLEILDIFGSAHVFPIVAEVYLKGRCKDIEKIPDCIKALHGLTELHIYGCPKIVSLPELPVSLTRLIVDTCESLETLTPFSSDSPIEVLYFSNCFKLGHEARRVITKKPRDAWLPGRNVPAEEFDHRAIGNCLTIPFDTYECRICVVVSPKQRMVGYVDLLCRKTKNGLSTGEQRLQTLPKVQSEHLYIGHYSFSDKLDSGVVLEFRTSSKDVDVVECGIKIFDRTNQ
ncbi:unnamed protein product [Microthlaspi erraticum]|uniref:Uncharacterized protein n=1 Tax=Microthlaspi erraticum TaxID=1685480 RepID=A0A6D2KL88_9BRAS|nr:unnamed protein product [Microthlaspi erraticum]